jgi:hypothetical protein
VAQAEGVLTLRERLNLLRADHPNAVIHTELVEHDGTRGTAIVKATVTAGRAVATAYASWSRDRSGAYVDHAETAALARALMRLGYGRRAVQRKQPSAAWPVNPRPPYGGAAGPVETPDVSGADDAEDEPDVESEEISSRVTAKQLRQLTRYGVTASSLALARYGQQLDSLEINQAEELLRELERL